METGLGVDGFRICFISVLNWCMCLGCGIPSSLGAFNQNRLAFLRWFSQDTHGQLVLKSFLTYCLIDLVRAIPYN